MIRWVLVGLGVALGGGASAQNLEALPEAQSVLNGLNGRPLRANPFGGMGALQLAIQQRAVPVPVPGAVPRESNGDGPKPSARRIRTPGPTPGGPARFDRNGDRLPAGAVARFGTARLRHGAEPAGLGFSPDGRLLASASVSEDGLRLWDVKTGKEVGRLDGVVTAAAFARDGHVVVVDDARCKVWHPAADAVRELPENCLPEGTTVVAVNPDCRSFAAAGAKAVSVLDIQTGKPLRELKLPGTEPANRMAYSPDGRWLAAVGPRTGGVWLWDLRTGKRVRTYPVGEATEACDFAFSPKSDRLAVAAAQLKMFPLDAEEEIDGFTPPPEPLANPAFTADGKFVLGLNGDGGVVRIDADSGEVKDARVSPDPENIRGPFALAADGSVAAATDQHGAIRVWNAETGEEPDVPRLTGLSHPGFSADGKTAACLDSASRLLSFDPATGAGGKVFRLPTDPNTPVSWDPRTRRAAAVVNGEETEIRVIDVDAGTVTAKFPPPLDSGLPAVVFCPADRGRAAVLNPGSAAVVSAATGRVIRTLDVGPTDNTPHGCFSPDGRLLAVATNTVGVWEVVTGKKRFDLDALPNALGVTFAPDGRLLAAWDNTDTVLLFDVRAGAAARRFQLPGADGSLSAAAFSPDGKRLATGTDAGTVVLWDAVTADVLLVLDRHEGQVTGFAFSPDGSRLVSTGSDGTALVWDLTVRPRPRAANPGVGGFDDAFHLLGSPDARLAQRGIEFFYRTPAEAMKQLAARIPVPPPTPPERIAKLVAELDSDDFPTRATAAKELEAVGGEAAAALRAAAEASASAEVRKAAAELAAKVAAPGSKPDELRAVRAVEVAEHLGTPAARELLKKWAAGPAGHRLTVEAAAAVARLK
jgi:WD40 repeat protein